MNTKIQPHFIAIAGGTAGGKTTFAQRCMEIGKAGEVSIVYLDSYYHSQDHISLEERSKVNYDHPDAFEVSLLLEHLQDLKQGSAVHMPRYDFGQHTRAKEGYDFAPTPIVLIEGILTLHFAGICEIADTTIFVDCPDEIRLERRIERDVRERDRTRASVIKQWEETVQPMHFEFCLPTRELAKHVVDGTQVYESFINELLVEIRSAE